MARIPMNIANFQDVNLELEFDTEDIIARNGIDRPVLVINANLKPSPHTNQQLVASQPRLLDLHGALYIGNIYQDVGAQLRPSVYDQVVLGQYTLRMPLVFELTRGFLQYLEQERVKAQPNADMTLALTLWGTVTMTSTASNTPGATIFGNITTVTYPNATFRIARSDWLERILPGLGYDEILLVELPLPKHPTAPEEIKEAVQLLSRARQHLNAEKYREAVQSCRQAKDALIKRNPNGIKSLLEPLLGNTKATMSDDALLAFAKVYTAASHPRTQPSAEKVEINRDDATFVVNSLTLILEYVASVLHTQGVNDS